MNDSQITGDAELTLGGGIYPIQAKLGISVARRFGSRSQEVLQPAIDVVGSEAVAARLRDSEELDAIVMRAMVAAGTTAHKGKRKLLAKIVQSAVLDDAEIDPTLLILELLEQLEGPHIRCLEDIHRAEQRARESGEMGEVAPRAEKPITNEVSNVVKRYPEILVRRLHGLQLIEGSITWDGGAIITGTTSSGIYVLRELHNTSL